MFWNLLLNSMFHSYSCMNYNVITQHCGLSCQTQTSEDVSCGVTFSCYRWCYTTSLPSNSPIEASCKVEFTQQSVYYVDPGRKHSPPPGLSECTCSDCSPAAARRIHARHQKQRESSISSQSTELSSEMNKWFKKCSVSLWNSVHLFNSVFFQFGDTCLHVAARYNNLTLVKILLNSLCRVTERNQVQDVSRI